MSPSSYAVRAMLTLVAIFACAPALSALAQPSHAPGGTGAVGGCCLFTASGSLTCIELTQSDCFALSGLWQGRGVPCTSPNACAGAPVGACCIPVGGQGQGGGPHGSGPLPRCISLNQVQCENRGGVFHGIGTVCMPTTCPPPPTPTGACCLAGGACITLTAQNCRVQGGVYQGDGADCAVTPCPGAPRGACCVQIHGSRGNSGATSNCILTDRVRCNIQGGTYVGDNTDCRTANCPPTQPLMGACCTAGQCTVTTAQTCRSASGIYFGDRTVCTTTSCPGAPTGACCQSTSGGAVVPCAIRTRAACVSVGGAYRGDGVACQSVSCIAPHLGACCVPLSGGGHGCVQVRSADCTTLGGSFLGASVACPSVQCPPPCPCDINGDGVVDLADEVAFLTLFNANMADLDNDGDTDQDDAAVFYSCYPQGCP